MARKLRPPPTQLLRAGERNRLLIADKAVPLVRFRASTLQGEPAGRIEVETGTEAKPVLNVVPLAAENRIDGADLLRIAVIPQTDTAITFLPVEPQSSPIALIGGGVLVIGAFVWTLFEMIG